MQAEMIGNERTNATPPNSQPFKSALLAKKNAPNTTNNEPNNANNSSSAVSRYAAGTNAKPEANPRAQMIRTKKKTALNPKIPHRFAFALAWRAKNNTPNNNRASTPSIRRATGM